MALKALKVSQHFTGLSKTIYRLLEPASTFHKHVWVAQSESNGRLVLFKSPLRPQPEDQATAARQLNNEIQLLACSFKDVKGIRQVLDTVKLQDVCTDEAQAGIFEYLETDLHKFHLTDKKSLALSQIKSCAHQLLEGLCTIHNKNVIHTDLKMENVGFSLLKTKDLFWRTSSEYVFKILDFGVEDRARTITNPYWRSPESWLGLKWGPATDIWSFGAIIGSLLMEPGAKLLQMVGDPGKLLPEERDIASIRALWTFTPLPPTLVSKASLELQNEIAQFQPVLAPNGQPMTLSLIGELFEADKEGWAFITAAMEADPDKRPTAEQLLLHSWLK